MSFFNLINLTIKSEAICHSEAKAEESYNTAKKFLVSKKVYEQRRT